MRGVVTGAASGIGRTTCLRLARDASARGEVARIAAVDVAPAPGLDGLVSNTGINRPGALVDYSVEDRDRVVAVNTRATWLLAKAAHPAPRGTRGAPRSRDSFTRSAITRG